MTMREQPESTTPPMVLYVGGEARLSIQDWETFMAHFRRRGADLAAARRALERAEQQKYTMQDEARAERDAARQEAATLRAEVTIYWEALTDLIIGAEQQSQSHADVIARASEALVAAKSVTEPGG